MYLARRTAVQQFKFADSFVANFYTDVKPINHLQLSINDIFLTQAQNFSFGIMSRDSKVRAWYTTTLSAVRPSCCVGMTSVPGASVDMQSHESLLYIAAGSSVTAVDLRTMQKVITAAVHQPKLFSFYIAPSMHGR